MYYFSFQPVIIYNFNEIEKHFLRHSAILRYSATVGWEICSMVSVYSCWVVWAVQRIWQKIFSVIKREKGEKS